MDEVEHLERLTEKARAALDQSDEYRIERIRSPRWITYPAAKVVLKRLEYLYTYPKTHRMPGVLIVGHTTNGKTKIIEQFLKQHPASDNPEGECVNLPVLACQVPPTPDEGRFYNRILQALAAPYKESDRPDKKLFQIETLQKRVGVRMLILDEIHDILAGSTNAQRNFRNTIKYLSNVLRVPIVTVGTREALVAIQVDEQLANRLPPLYLPRWEMNEDYFQLLAGFETTLPLRKPSNLDDTPLALELLNMSDGLIGEISDVISRAAIHAIETKTERINLQTLREIGIVSPSGRKQDSKVQGANV